MPRRSYRNLALLSAWAGLLLIAAFCQELLPRETQVFPKPADLIPGWAKVAPLFARSETQPRGQTESGNKPDSKPDAGTNKEAKHEKESPLTDGKRHERLTHFFRALQNLKHGKTSHVRIVHYGDSINWADNVSFRLKTNFQKDFGDGGRGLVTIVDSKESVLKGHRNLTKAGFRLHQINEKNFHRPVLNELGFTAKSFEPERFDVETVQAAPEDALPWKRLEVLLRAPADRATKGRLTLTSDDTGERKEVPFDVAAGQCRGLEESLPSTRSVRMQVAYDQAAPFIDGLQLETERGVAYSAIIRMGVHQAWMNTIPDANLECGYRWYRPDLIVFEFGVNESASIETLFFGYTGERYERELRHFYERLRKILPDTSILMIGPLERVKTGPAGLQAVPAQMEVRRIQKKLADEFGIAFFDTYEFMGGPGHIIRMVQKGLALNDYMHLSRDGGDMIADGVYAEIAKAYTDETGESASANGTSGANGPSGRDRNTSAEGGEKPAPKFLSDNPSDAILFNSRSYAVFLFAVLIISSVLIRWPAWRMFFFAAASVYFYTSWMVWPILLILFSTGTDFLCAQAIERARAKGGRGSIFLVLSLVANLGLLFFFKYYDFMAGLANSAMGLVFHAKPIPLLHLLLPVGISFYTFQSLSYTIDVWRGSLRAERSVLRFGFFVMFFPQLVAGPIVRASTFLPAIKHKVRHFVVTNRRFNEGLFLILIGLLKKMLADWIGVTIVDRVYASPQMFTSLENLAAIYGYGLQIYGDFSGYSDIAIGSAMLLGFHLTENFNRPYQSASITEFWRRWHISLGSWLRDYLYIGLGGNRTGVIRNLLITMFLAGLWHGAGVNFVAWGVFHGLVLVAERWTGLDRRSPKSPLEHSLRVFLTLHLVLLAWIPFRLNDTSIIQAVLDGLRSGNWKLQNLEWRGLTLIAAGYLWHLTPVSWRTWIQEVWQRLAWPVQGAIAAGTTVVLFQLAMPNVQPFIYFQF